MKRIVVGFFGVALLLGTVGCDSGTGGGEGMPKDLTPPSTDNIPKADMAAGKVTDPSKDPAKAQAAKAAADNAKTEAPK